MTSLDRYGTPSPARRDTDRPSVPGGGIAAAAFGILVVAAVIAVAWTFVAWLFGAIVGLIGLTLKIAVALVVIFALLGFFGWVRVKLSGRHR
jgi:hypothetical protein